MSRTSRVSAYLSVLGLVVFCGLVCISEAKSASLRPGDILVVDEATQTLIRIDPRNGSQKVLSRATFFVSPADVIATSRTSVFVADSRAFSRGGIIKFKPNSGAQVPIASGNPLFMTRGIEVDSNGELIAITLTRAVIKIDPETGAHTIISQGSDLESPVGLALEADGSILVVVEEGLGGEWRCYPD